MQYDSLSLEVGGSTTTSASRIASLAIPTVLLLLPVAERVSALEAELELRPLVHEVEEGETFVFEARVVAPGCGTFAVEMSLILSLGDSLLTADSPDVGLLSIDGKPRGELPLQLTLKEPSLVLELETLDDKQFEPDEVVRIEGSPGDRVPPQFQCTDASTGKDEQVELATKVAVLDFRIIDNDEPPPSGSGGGGGDDREKPLILPEAEPEFPRVTLGGDGRKGVVFSAHDENGPGAFVQIFDKARSPITPVVRVGSLGAEDLGRHAIAVLPGGRFFVVRSTGPSSAGGLATSAASVGVLEGGTVVGTFFSPNGTPEGEVSLTDGANEVGVPSVETDGSGNLAITWEEDGEGHAQVLGPAGAPQGEVLDLGGASQPAVGGSPNGDFVTAWVSSQGEGILVRRFKESGAPQGAALVVTPGAAARHPDVAARDDGAFVVVWSDVTQSGSDVFARRYSADGVAQGAAFLVNEDRDGDQTRPRIDANAAGDFAVVWESDLPPAGNAASLDGGSVVGRFFDFEGTATGEDEPVATADGGTTPAAPDVAVDDDDEVTVVVERRGPGGTTEGIFETVLQPTIASGECTPNASTLCLAGGRFRVTANWQNAALEGGPAGVRPLTGDTGAFWFFEESNLEVVLKVLDGCALNGHTWVFAGGLTDVEVNVVVDDVIAGKSRSYFKAIGAEFQPITDVLAFACGSAAGSTPAAAQAVRVANEAWSHLQEQLAAEHRVAREPLAIAAPLTLAGGRFHVEVDWTTGAGQSGAGEGVALSNDTGYFWFFDAANVEMLLKVLDGCSLNGHYWVFAGGLTDVGVRIRVTDTTTGETREFESTVGQPFQPVRDLEAFGCS